MVQGRERKPIVMIHANPARIERNRLTVDRKFHVGMLRYAELIRSPIVTVNPPLSPGQKVMDPIEVPLTELSYGIQTAIDPSKTVSAIKAARLVYGYENSMRAATIAREHGIPYIMIAEYDLQTKMTEAVSSVTDPFRRLIRRARSAVYYYRRLLPEIRNAHSLHCNGYPVFEAMKPHNPNRMLYLDSRMSAEMLITDAELIARLDKRQGMPIRLLYSGALRADEGSLRRRKGRYGMRQAWDVNRDALLWAGQPRWPKCRRLRPSGQFKSHPAIPYPELAKVSRTFDAFGVLPHPKRSIVHLP